MATVTTHFQAQNHLSGCLVQFYVETSYTESRRTTFCLASDTKYGCVLTGTQCQLSLTFPTKYSQRFFKYGIHPVDLTFNVVPVSFQIVLSTHDMLMVEKRESLFRVILFYFLFVYILLRYLCYSFICSIP